MYFKVEKGVPLWNKLEELMNRIIEVRQAAKDLVNEMGFTEYGAAHFVVAGGISFVYSPDRKPDGYRSVGKSWQQFYFPKAVNKVLCGKIAALPVVKHNEYNDVINFKDQFVGLKHIMAYGLKKTGDTFLIEVSDDAKYTPIEGMIEILASEYKMWVDSIGEAKSDEDAE